MWMPDDGSFYLRGYRECDKIYNRGKATTSVRNHPDVK